ncbi:transcription antitermination factor NusB [Amylibacter sp. IMCC11727]|uniref:RsmB/NOP family class I SAM-dependent RNA methyltransferase n=1 Tax=Amylibacter sp. IMCC11727 TaxID=3039851 RepID=UPI00244DA993|nr:transcription antitermination factor NusB [Amylibacter sp. IMCC11727]WGI22597.1 transcription antitermination factor NusB [Amylibacter sp. IMCC11727]
MTTATISARFGAVALIHAVLMDKQMLGDAISREDGPISKLAPPDRARAQSLAALTLRHMPRLDAILDGFLEHKPPLRALNALRVCAAEIVLDGIPAHGAVNAAVEIVRGSTKTKHLGGMVNAVGRKLGSLDVDSLQDLPVPQLPKALRGAMVKAYGEESMVAIERAHLERPPFDLSLKDIRKAQQWAETLGAEVLPTGSLRLRKSVQISAMQGYESGDWWVQDAAAAMPVRLLGDIKGKRVLDLCAAPGGKTMQLCAAGADVTALDLSPERMHRVMENTRRMGFKPRMEVANAMDWEPDAPFDVILLDAPCSATGTIRRHPDLPYVRPTLDLKPLLNLQQAMMQRAAGWLKAGGQMVYATCSLIPAEGERQIARAVDGGALEEASLDPATFGLDPAWAVSTGAIRLRPDYWSDLGGMDGFYMALLNKR